MREIEDIKAGSKAITETEILYKAWKYYENYLIWEDQQ